MVNTTCTYDQAMRAVHAENPMAAQYLDQSKPNLQFLQTFFASSPAERVNLLKAIQNNPGADQALPVFQQMMTDCKNY
jgi:hemophore-related protein